MDVLLGDARWSLVGGREMVSDAEILAGVELGWCRAALLFRKRVLSAGRTVATVSAYCQVIEQFRLSVPGKEFNAVVRADVDAFLESASSPAVAAKWLQALRLFFNWLMDNGYALSSPCPSRGRGW